MSTPVPIIVDPLLDGAADPVLVWNCDEKSRWCLFGHRRANTRLTRQGWIGRCHGTPAVYYVRTGDRQLRRGGADRVEASLCQVAAIRVAGGSLVCDRDAELELMLPIPATTTARRSVTSP